MFPAKWSPFAYAGRKGKHGYKLPHLTTGARKRPDLWTEHGQNTMQQTKEQPLTLASLKRILAEHDERLTKLESDKATFNPDEIWTAQQTADYGKMSYGYFMQKLANDPHFPASVGTPKKNAPKKYRAEDVIEFFKRRNRLKGTVKGANNGL